ncbi:tripartite tricarboxylate transporter substrate-binding protein [Hydrogenophaga sp.]|uniref:tripartite tricarboxylate transporter substrate-binding protein n=1 Tax=Hydrogenophaga sp. TaxID=1904254 RepID=UPI0027184623|nr:tripartite tricarboxylate transporter substrate-binding protein [Hydrogenophaga sp.]MDO9438850.1 tripartite tricarboxylate transporter substrate-binding protein [Hydrogenophaga sp.]
MKHFATVYPTVYAMLAYDPTVDLQPVSLASEMSLGVAVGPAVPTEVTTLADFIAWLRKHPGESNIGSPGSGTLPHLLEAMLLREEGVAWQHVAYAGGPPAHRRCGTPSPALNCWPPSHRPA